MSSLADIGGGGGYGGGGYGGGGCKPLLPFFSLNVHVGKPPGAFACKDISQSQLAQLYTRKDICLTSLAAFQSRFEKGDLVLLSIGHFLRGPAEMVLPTILHGARLLCQSNMNLRNKSTKCVRTLCPCRWWWPSRKRLQPWQQCLGLDNAARAGLLPLLYFRWMTARFHSNADPAFGPQQAKHRAHVPLGETGWPNFDVHWTSRLYIPAHALGVGRMSLRSRLGNRGTFV